MRALIVVPAYNEERTIAQVIAGLRVEGFNEIVVVDDGSRDMTVSEARKAGKAWEAGKVAILRHIINLGQGAALETGNEYARRNNFDCVAHFDGDDQHDVHDIKTALKVLEEKNADVILGSRFLKSNSVPFVKRYFILPVARIVNFLFTGVWLSDAHNGFRVLTKRALEVIRITQPGMAHNSEIVAQIKKNNLKFVEIPVTVKYHEFGQGLRGGVKVLIDLIKGLLL